MEIAAAESRTNRAFIGSRILETPFWAVFNMVPFILYKDLEATPIQLAIVIALKPLSSLFSTYWSSLTGGKRSRLLSNVIWGNLLRLFPFLLLPLFANSWALIAAFGFQMMLARGAQPAWMEILKLNIPAVSRERVFSYGSVAGYVGDAVFPFIIGPLMDSYFHAWRWLFPITALLALAGILLQMRIPLRPDEKSSAAAALPSIKEHVARPWKAAWNLILTRPDFAKFQIGFMLGGAGVMIMQPALPIFFVDKLRLSYMELSIAISLCKGIGFAATSPFWARWIHRIDIYRFNAAVTLLAALFPLCLFFSQLQHFWLFFAYIAYGVMQAGSNLSWNMSGPIFSREEDSSLFTSVNVAAVGIRGCFVPLLGSLLSSLWGASWALTAGALLCLLATYRLFMYSLAVRKRLV